MRRLETPAEFRNGVWKIVCAAIRIKHVSTEKTDLPV